MIKQSIIDYKKKRDLEKKKRLNVINLRNRFLGEWASSILGLDQIQIKNYIKSIKSANKKNKDSKSVIEKIEKDFFFKKINISYSEIEFKLKEFEIKAYVIAENKLKLDNQKIT